MIDKPEWFVRKFASSFGVSSKVAEETRQHASFLKLDTSFYINLAVSIRLKILFVWQTR